MSGHSKWSTIKHKKAAQDKKRGDVFTKMAKIITVAVRTGGGGDPDSNFTLRLAMDKARASNMPKDNIQRAIDRGLGKGGNGVVLEEAIFEGYGPEGVPIIVETVTDNRQRTVAELKNIFDRSGGALAGPGAVMYQFERVGMVEYEGNMDDDIFLELIDVGAKDVDKDESGGVVYSSPEDVQRVKVLLTEKGFQNVNVELGYKSSTTAQLEEAKKSAVVNFIDILREHDDVQEVYSTFSEA